MAAGIPEGNREELEAVRDPKYSKTSAGGLIDEEVTGLADALYTEPSEAPL
jgi:hypothetical protein